jgi:hypothetical protein
MQVYHDEDADLSLLEGTQIAPARIDFGFSR